MKDGEISPRHIVLEHTTHKLAFSILSRAACTHCDHISTTSVHMKNGIKYCMRDVQQS